MKCRSCGCEMGAGDLYCPSCGLKREAPYPEVGEKTETRGMAWYKFLIYVALFLTAFADIAGGISQIIGGQYMGLAGDVYALYPALRPVDVIAGAALVVLGAFAVYTRYRLAGFRQNGPLCLYLLTAGDLVLSLAYTFSTSLVIGKFASDLTFVVRIILALIILGLNAMYFSKRDDLFVNP